MELLMEMRKKWVTMRAAGKVTDGQRSHRYFILHSFFFIYNFHLSVHTPSFLPLLPFKSNCLSEVTCYVPFPTNASSAHTQTHTHLYVCDLQRAIFHQGQSRCISLKSLSVLLPWNLDWGTSIYTAIELCRCTPRYGLIGWALANDWRDTTWRTCQFEWRRGGVLC